MTNCRLLIKCFAELQCIIHVRTLLLFYGLFRPLVSRSGITVNSLTLVKRTWMFGTRLVSLFVTRTFHEKHTVRHSHGMSMSLCFITVEFIVLRYTRIKHSRVKTVMQRIQGGSKKFPTCFSQNFVKSPPNLIMFGTQMAKTIELCEVHPMSISPNLCQSTTVLKADAPNCCIMLSCCARKSSNDLIKHTIN